MNADILFRRISNITTLKHSICLYCTSVPFTRIQISQSFACFSADFVSMPYVKRSTSKISTVLKVDIPIAVNHNKCYYSCQHMLHVSVVLTILRHKTQDIYNSTIEFIHTESEISQIKENKRRKISTVYCTLKLIYSPHK